jgi:hypothetical protein
MLQQMNSKRGFAKLSARARAMNSNEATPKKAPACKRKKGGKCKTVSNYDLSWLTGTGRFAQ